MNKRYKSDVLKEFRKQAIREKGGEVQLGILEAIRSKNHQDFVGWFEDNLKEIAGDEKIIEGQEEPKLPPTRFTRSEFITPPHTTLSTIWGLWGGMSVAEACQPFTWAYIGIRLIKNEKIDPDYLIDYAKDKEETSVIDGHVRTFLRRLSGFPERGNRSVPQDCRMARAWWQCYLASQIHSSFSQNFEGIDQLFENTVFWRSFSERIFSGLTVIGDENIRAGIVLFMLDRQNNRFLKTNPLREFFKSIGAMTAWRALGYFEPEQIKEIITEIVAQTPLEEQA